ncbi:MAG TPA: S-layer homology domain-containing protein, partial [Chloroflexia bacterium]|nr:S-layer homology domain-containing protein [Chloroflexia bacterium]
FDYYGAHYYGWMDSPFNNGSPMAIDCDTTQKELDAPVVIGELPANGGSATVYLPSVRSSNNESTTLSLRYICTAYAPNNDPTCTRPYTATIEYDNPNGTAAFTQTLVVPPYGGWTGALPVGGGSFTGAARIFLNGPVAAAITQTGILSSTEQTMYTGQDQANLTTWLPLVTNHGTHRSRLAVQSTAVHTATVTVRYYDATGAQVASDTLTLAPHGSALIDPLLPGSPTGPPPGFDGSAVITSTWPLVATAYELDPQLGSDAYNGEGQGYLSTVYLPSVRNWGTEGAPTLYVQNPCCGPAQVTISYYSLSGTLAASQALSMPEYGSATVDPQDVLAGGFEGSVIITSDQHPAAVMRSVTTHGQVSTTALYAGTQNPDQRLHFPVVHKLNTGGSGQETTFNIQNVSPTSPITVWVTLNDNNGGTTYFNNAIVIAPRSEWVASTSDLPGVPDGFSGTAEVLWPWPSATGWSEGYPLLATARDIDSASSRSSIYRAVATHSQYWAVTPYRPEPLLEGIFDNHWAGALSWSFYDQGTGSWDDFRDAMVTFDAAHPDDVRIGHSMNTPVPTPTNESTATAQATATPTYESSPTASPTVMLTGTPVPTCPACSVQFIDVLPGSTFYDYVRCLACRGVFSGYPDGTFRPNNGLTRGQLSKIVSNAAGYDEAHSEQSFEDVTTGSTFYIFVQRLSSRGIIAGYPCGGVGEPCIAPDNRPYFRPGANVTRGQASKIVSNAFFPNCTVQVAP